MNNLVAPHILGLTPYEPGKPESELQRELGLARVVKLASNENPYGPSPRALAALAGPALDMHRYPDPTAHDLRSALAQHHGVALNEVCLGNGSNELIDLVCRVFARRGDHAVFGHPSFPCYRIACTAQEVAYTAVPLRDDLHWSVDDLLAAITPKTKLLFVSNPNNPTGTYVGRPALERLLRAAPPDVVIVIDEAYVEYPDAADYASAWGLRGERDPLIVLRTFSKAYGLAALRVGYALGRPPLIEAIHRLRAPFNVGTLGQRAAQAALTDQAHVQRCVEATQHERRRLTESLESRGYRLAPSQANFVLFDVKRPGRAVYEALLHAGVIVRAMAPPLESWLRVTVGRPEENDHFVSALDALRVP